MGSIVLSDGTSSRDYGTSIVKPVYHLARRKNGTTEYAEMQATENCYLPLAAAKKEIESINLTQLRDSLSLGSLSTTARPALCGLDSTHIALVNSSADTLTCYVFNAPTWSVVGNALSITGISTAAIAGLSSTDVVIVDSTLQTLRLFRFDGTNWAQVGNALIVSGIFNPSLASLSSTDIAFIDNTVKTLRKYHFDGTNWAQVGNALLLSTSSYGVPSVSGLSSTDVCLVDGVRLQIERYHFDGTNWSLVGSGLSVRTTILGEDVTYPTVLALNENEIFFACEQAKAFKMYRWIEDRWTSVSLISYPFLRGTRPGLARLSSTSIAYVDCSKDKLNYISISRTFTSLRSIKSQASLQGYLNFSAGGAGANRITKLSSTDVAFYSSSTDNYALILFRYNGVSFVQVGNALSILSTNQGYISAMDSTTVAFIDINLDSLRVYHFDGTNWAQVGSGLSVTSNANPRVVGLSSTDIAFIEAAAVLRRYHFNGSVFAQVGNGLSTGLTGGATALAAFGPDDIAFISDVDATLRKYHFDGTNWAQVGNGFPMHAVNPHVGLAVISSSLVILTDGTSNLIRFFNFDGTDFVPFLDIDVDTFEPTIAFFSPDTLVSLSSVSLNVHKII